EQDWLPITAPSIRAPERPVPPSAAHLFAPRNTSSGHSQILMTGVGISFDGRWRYPSRRDRVSTRRIPGQPPSATGLQNEPLAWRDGKNEKGGWCKPPLRN